MDKFGGKPWFFANQELIILGAKACDLASFLVQNKSKTMDSGWRR